MEDFVKFINSKDISVPEKATEAHFKFVSIHPFIDGNGRTGRLLMNLILLKGGYQPVIIRPRDKKLYINSIEKRQLTQDTSQYTEFMFKCLKRSLNTYIDMFDNSRTDSFKNLMKISDFAKAANVPVSTIRYYLRVGKIKPAAVTDSDYMLFDKKQIKEIKK